MKLITKVRVVCVEDVTKSDQGLKNVRKTSATLFLVLSMGTPTAPYNLSVQHW